MKLHSAVFLGTVSLFALGFAGSSFAALPGDPASTIKTYSVAQSDTTLLMVAENEDGTPSEPVDIGDGIGDGTMPDPGLDPVVDPATDDGVVTDYDPVIAQNMAPGGPEVQRNINPPTSRASGLGTPAGEGGSSVLQLLMRDKARGF
jgi:hypothetical protein